uniref:Uncharacterized protein n=1 Tax=Arundo donax TaxID=35708 RepID=A0A0A8ZBK7_ARUDO
MTQEPFSNVGYRCWV